jgi:hypothetical protein
MKRVILSVVAIAVYLIAVAIYSPQATLISGQAAGLQFQSSDSAFLSAVYTMNFLSAVGVALTFALICVLIAIWWHPANHVWEDINEQDTPPSRPRSSDRRKLLIPIAIAILGLGAGDARAYYDSKDVTEAYTILPNESAFWIPDVGNNKDSQAKLDSEDYYKANKLAVKRFIIPHAKLTGTGGFLGWDAYVPTGRLIIVPRAPFSREWVAQAHRGTSKKDESFPCQTKEGLNISAGVSIGTSVAEENAAKYLYRAGVVSPTGQARNDPQVIFASVYYGRSLADFMDDVGRKKVQTLVCEEISSRGFDQANADTNPIMAAVQKKALEYFAAYGITLDFIGWADTFTFDPEVQKVVNDKYAADKLASAMTILQAVAQLKVQEGLGAGLTTHGLPIVVTPDMINALIGMVKAPPPVK